MKPHIRKRTLKGVLWALWLTAVTAVIFSISRYWVQLMLIRGNSMMPSYHNMQIVFVDKRIDRYQRGDVVAFFNERLEERRIVLVKRVAAVPGDILHIVEGTLLVNGQVSEQFPQKGIFDDPGIAAEPIELDDGEYFVIGDNVAESKDSRYEIVGILSKEQLIGKVID